MNEFTAKKLGEVLAFSFVGVENFEKSKEALGCFLSYDEIENKLRVLQDQGKILKEIAEEASVLQISLPKSEKTAEKLLLMRDIYLKAEDYDNPSEVAEWLGFFEGAAIVHFQLVKGAAESSQNEKLLSLSYDAIALHNEIFDCVADYLSGHGKNKALES